ncbi:hypothetical protein VE04_06440 [Pseudogymnoascus sp. 24MN13]|nr:hypothetical protein VE04_06440 [Pseudogymnoascus sp. 24MN13]
MHSILPIVVLLAVCDATSIAIDRGYPNEAYINDMCSPLFKSNYESNEALFAALGNSPLPCEQNYFLNQICMSNGTTPNDFLAEQQCLCNGNYFEVGIGCYDCQVAHGVVVKPSDRASFISAVSSRRKVECSAVPTQGYTNLFTAFNYTSYHLRSDLTLSSDNFPNDTRVENYWTGAATATPGKITGSAVHHQSIKTNIHDSRFTPTPAAATGGSVTTPSAPTSTGNADTATSTGGAAEVRVAGGLLAAVIGVLAVL